VAQTGNMAGGRQVVYCYITYSVLASTLAAAPGDVGPLSSHVSDRRGWWWLRLVVKTTAGDRMLMLQAAGASVVYMYM